MTGARGRVDTPVLSSPAFSRPHGRYMLYSVLGGSLLLLPHGRDLLVCNSYDVENEGTVSPPPCAPTREHRRPHAVKVTRQFYIQSAGALALLHWKEIWP